MRTARSFLRVMRCAGAWKQDGRLGDGRRGLISCERRVQTTRRRRRARGEERSGDGPPPPTQSLLSEEIQPRFHSWSRGHAENYDAGGIITSEYFFTQCTDFEQEELGGGEKNPSFFRLMHKSVIWICADVTKKIKIKESFHLRHFTPLTRNSQQRPRTGRVQFGLQLPVAFFSKTPGDSFGGCLFCIMSSKE